MKPRVFLTRELPPAAMEFLEEHTELEYNADDRVLEPDELLAGAAGKDGLLCLLIDKIDESFIDANPGLKVIANYAVGFNNIDVEAATRRGIPVTNTPDVLTETTADMAFVLLMAVARRLVEGDRLVRSRSWSGWAPLQLLGSEVTGASLGLVGLGRIGRAVVPRARGFDMDVYYWNRTKLDAEEEARLGVNYLPFDELLATVDFVSMHVAYNEVTHHLIDARALGLMRPEAYLINTTRGAVVDEKALVDALKSGAIRGAGLDVFENEPALEPELYDLDNAVLTPHLGSATLDARTNMALKAARNLLAACSGERPPNLVNDDVAHVFGR